ncbi:Phospho-2-dehydro-3-deoxyheptonate aldolase, Phe-sensitive [Candidatus Kinetoplastibacterium sorsogonicusi]|uniref:Phospho-2-dehydro-3-deoxyheptonate aldolase n=1 Tax=Candidatus Kinetoplastidibacterium kentomonadis TaxID=1576550 RepID=A0A3Q8EUA9_9PROT|nr:3-deoxy-7-phosphoheptulonate synthase [Candidatus Kinetoplastibacterium sorsogonicusi]AWD32466.1 Phospho-2-dehydro-3-deoxyheptonate aldolase, Phe-sensitive [Candidatus Kinetoplastibacterium sorsogonicusi]
MSHNTDDIRIREIRELNPPSHVMREFPCNIEAAKTVHNSRKIIHKILHNQSNKLVLVVGPCSIHDVKAAIDYAKLLKELKIKYSNDLEIVMRVYFEKPRTTIGWKGLINDPDMDRSFQINKGLKLARQLLLEINTLGLSAGCEYLDMITPQYIADLVSWGAIGARTTESQVHRELSSGLSCPVGFKNGTDGNIKIAIDAIKSASNPHNFLSVTKGGHSAIVSTNGNEDCHIILRGGKKPNYDSESINLAANALKKSNLLEKIMIDASHSNSNKNYENQPIVIEDIAKQIESGDNRIFGVMIESNLKAGRQDLLDPRSLIYGLSITDGCIDWETTEKVIDRLAKAVNKRNKIS